MLDIIVTYRQAFQQGLMVTLQLCLVVWAAGLLLGVPLGAASARFQHSLGRVQLASSFFLSGVPILVFLFWAHFPLQKLLGVVIDPFITASCVLAIVNVVAVADAVRTTLLDLPEQHVLAAKACGLPRSTTLFRIKLPLVTRQLVPTILPIQITMLHTTLFASLISVEEVFRVAQRINSRIYQPVEIYTALGLLFLCISLPVNGLALWLRGRFTRRQSER